MHTPDSKDTHNRVYFDYDKYKALKEAYMKAVQEKQLSFVFNGREYITLYAKYVVEYLRVILEIDHKGE